MTSDPFDLGGKVAIVTGAGSGIGQATAQRFAERCATVIGVDVKNTDVTCDVSDRAAVHALVDDVVRRHGHLDVMCNIAGIMHDSSVLETEEADLDRVLATNFKGVLWGCQAAGRKMVEQGSGSIINAASTAIDMGAPNLICYSSAKAAVTSLTKTMATEVGPSGVRVNAVAPGYIATGMTAGRFVREDGSVDDEGRDRLHKLMASMAPLRRIGAPDDIAWSIVYLASDASSFVTGQIIRPNGGASMPW
jgi:3-oxoacyl-[acyl-carrier protein] reductase